VWRAIRRRVRNDTGAVIIMTALFLPVALLFCGFVIDVANWFEHDRHLQTQADAAALAGAGSFLACPNNDPILEKTDEYGGETWNEQVGDTQDSVHMEVNSKTYFDQPDWEDPTVDEGTPCETGMVDVKLTETDLPWWFDITQDVDYINAHARVEFQEVDTMNGALPFAVPDVKPETARVWFINEDTGQPLTATDGNPATHLLTRKTYTGGVAYWDNLEPGAAVEVTLPAGGASNIGVRVALSGSTSTNCADPLVTCYDAGSANGILYGRAWARDPATSTAPKARHVGLTSAVTNGCSDPYFTQAPAGGCNVGVEAQIDFGGAVPNGTSVDAVVGNKKYAMQYDTKNTPTLTDDVWISTQFIPIDPAGPPVSIGLEWKKGNTGGSLGTQLQRTFSASAARSGPIQTAVLFSDDGTGQRSGVSSFEQCSTSHPTCTYKLAVQLGIQGSFEDIYNDLRSVTAPVTLRFAGGASGSQNQALDCDPWNETNADPDLKLPNGTRSFIGEIALGCRPGYMRNQGMTCPSSPNVLWGSSTSTDNQGPAWQCVAVETGDRVSQIATGLNLRILGDKNPRDCTHPNNWDTVIQAPDPAEASDPRIVQLFLTQFGAFSSSGQNTVAVTNFATFYVTGWKGQGGHTSPCADPDNPDVPADDPVAEAGTVVGHWMKYRGALGDSHGTRPCDPNSPTPCVFSLTE
jgi:Putative Flp pilus-assembly TadE/G-like